MPANHKVSVAWQIVFTFLPIVNFWAFYRIRKLRKYLLYAYVPALVTSIIILGYVYSGGFLRERTGEPSGSGPYGELIPKPDGPTYYPYDFVTPGPVASVIGSITGWGLQAFAVYLVIIWSRQHNRTFDTPPT